MALDMIITSAGLARFAAAQGGAEIDLTVSQVGVTASGFVLSPTLTALPGEIKRLSTVSGAAIDAYTLHMTLTDGSTDGYALRGFGLFLADGTLFAVYGGTAVLMEKSPASTLLLAIDLGFPAGAVDLIGFGDTSFLNPYASESGAGVIELATQAEVDAGADGARAVTPLRLAARLAALTSGMLGTVNTSLLDYIPKSWRGVANGVASLDGAGKVPVSQIALSPADVGAVPLGRLVASGGLVTGGGDLTIGRTLTVTPASNAEINAGTATDRAITPLGLAGRLDIFWAAVMTYVAGQVDLLIPKSWRGVANGVASLDGAGKVPVSQIALSSADVGAVPLGRLVASGGLVTGGGDLTIGRTLTVTPASNAEIEAGTSNALAVTPLNLQVRLAWLWTEMLAHVAGQVDLLIPRSWRGVANGVASLDGAGKVPVSQIALSPADVGAVPLGRLVASGGLVTGGGDLTISRTLTVTAASNAEIEAGTSNALAVTPLNLQVRLAWLWTEMLAHVTGQVALLIPRSWRGAANGVASLDGAGKVPVGQIDPASETKAGIAEIATVEEVNTGTGGDVIVTPATLGNRLGGFQTALANTYVPLSRAIGVGGLVTGGGDLTENRTVTVTSATAAEILAGTEAGKAITPAALAALGASLTANGWYKFPGGLMVAWGQFTAAANTSTSVSFATPFATACFSVVTDGVGQYGTDSQDNFPALIRADMTASGFAVFSADQIAAPCTYIAIGH